LTLIYDEHSTLFLVSTYSDLFTAYAVFSELSESTAGDVFFRTSSVHQFLWVSCVISFSYKRTVTAGWL